MMIVTSSIEGLPSMNADRPEYFPSVEQLKETRRQNAEALIGRIQTVGWMAQEFCSKLRNLGIEPRTLQVSGDRSLTGYVIQVSCCDDAGEQLEKSLFLAESGYVAPYESGSLEPFESELMHSDELVATYSQAMLDALQGTTLAMGELPDGWQFVNSGV